MGRVGAAAAPVQRGEADVTAADQLRAAGVRGGRGTWLQQVLVLKLAGCTLSQIAALVAASRVEPVALVEAQIAAIEGQCTRWNAAPAR